MTVEVLRSVSELRDITEPWAALADAADARFNMQPFWCVPWWKAVGKGELYVAVVESGGQLAALAPLYRERHFGVDTLRFLGSHMLGVSEVLVAPDQDGAGDELWDFLLNRPRSIVDLWQLRLVGPGAAALRRTEGHPRRVLLGPASPFVSLDGSWEDYWVTRRLKFRRELERTERAAERQGVPVRIEMALDPDDVDKRLPDVAKVFAAAERARSRLPMFSDVFRPFTLEMAQLAAEQSRLALFVLYLGDTPAATLFTLRGPITMGASGLRFDPDFAKFSPGMLLLRHIVEHAFASGCAVFDFGPRDVPYKREWATGAYDTVLIESFSSPAVQAVFVAQTFLENRRSGKAPSDD